jgi:Ca2+-binding EF-hand superfamily protein
MDKNGTGKIPVKHLRFLLQGLGEPLSGEEADELIAFCDKEKSGEIDYEAILKDLMDKDPGLSASM